MIWDSTGEEIALILGVPGKSYSTCGNNKTKVTPESCDLDDHNLKLNDGIKK